MIEHCKISFFFFFLITSFLCGDAVTFKNDQSQSGTVVNCKITCDLVRVDKVISLKHFKPKELEPFALKEVSSKFLKSITRFTVGDTVVYQQSIGVIDEVYLSKLKIPGKKKFFFFDIIR